MSVATSPAGTGSTRSNLYRSEVRFGVVMYGGVSLAIYINGVANELYEMACATPKVLGGSDAGGGTRDVYRKASVLLGSEDLREQYARHLLDPKATLNPLNDAALKTAERARFVVDVISGTSAGGINGAFLAKALANGQQFSPLKDLWIEEGNIDRLLNDGASYEGLRYAAKGSPPRSLLNSDRMYVKLLEAFQDMQPAMEPAANGESPLADEIDLYITTTDIRGTLVPMRLFDEVAYEKRFRQVYHFQYNATQRDGTTGSVRNDLVDNNAPFLAFAARCTSSFPFAFEPMTVADAQRLCAAKPEKPTIDLAKWKPFFTGLSSDDLASDAWRNRAFGDGGYLDNKPFSYVVEALSWRLGDLPMERKLIYVEPAPAHPETEPKPDAEKPDAIENAFKALTTIPQYETIREDLEAVLARNRRIERVERIVRQVEADIEARPTDPFARLKLIDGEVQDWSSLDLGEMIDYYGLAFLPYHRLRISAVTDDIAEHLAVRWEVDRGSDRFYALKAMARVWRETRYYEDKEKPCGRDASVNKFLDDYDLKYRIRRTGFLLRKVHQLRTLAISVDQGKERTSLSDTQRRLWDRLDKRNYPLLSMNHKALIAALNCLADGFGQSLQQLRAAVWPASTHLGAQPSEAERATLDQLLRLILGEKVDNPLTTLSAGGKESVRVAREELPPLNPRRTLQENVFARAQVLFRLAKEAVAITDIQTVLERDLAALCQRYEAVKSPSPGNAVRPAGELLGAPKLVPAKNSEKATDSKKTTDSELPPVGELPGDPQLAPSTDSKNTTAGKPKPVAVIQIEDTVGFCGGSLDTTEGTLLRKFLAEYYVRFDEYDQMSFPLYYDTGTGEPSTVEVLRVSPEGARSLIDERKGSRRKLAGTAVFNFGAFFDEQWRRNDIMWGRLDGCERLLAALFPDSGDKTKNTNKVIREDLLQEAHRTILREAMDPGAYAQLVDELTKALAKQKKGPLKDAFEELWEKLAPDEGQRSARMAKALKAVASDAGMVEYLREDYKVGKLDTGATMKTGARALTITGRILEESEKRYRVEKSRMVWVTRGGRALQALLTVSTPGSRPLAIFRHWLALLYLFESLIVGGAVLFSSPAMINFGLTCLGVTAALHVANLVAGDLMKSRRGWVKLIVFAFVLAVLGLAFLGAWAWYSNGFASIVCGGYQDRGWLLKCLLGMFCG